MSEFAPTEKWIEAFEEQATDELYAKATRYATRRAEGVARSGGVVDDLYIRGLVQDAFTDTLCGVLRWDPLVATLEQQIISAIRSRSRHDREHARRFRHVSIDAARDLPAANPERESMEVIAQLRACADGDADVIRLIDAICSGASARREIMNTAHLSTNRYRSARWRLASLVRQQISSIELSPEPA
jgi:hypothetical protein